MDRTNIYNISTATKNDKHHFFGFHDLVAFNKSGEKLLSLAVDEIHRPPLPFEKADVGYCLWETQEFIKLGETCAYNYPQGARQQWIDNDKFIVNNMINNAWGSEIYDVSDGRKIEEYELTCHCITKDSKNAFGINYSRLHRLGGYGYIGLDDDTLNDACPTNCGIWKLDLQSKNKSLILSIKEIARNGNLHENSVYHHYVTHLVLNPSNTRLAFLHRYFLPDGGIRTRLMTVGLHGEDLRCLASGFLSHFDWKDDETLFIWGRSGNAADKLRSNKLLSNPIVSPAIRLMKNTLRTVLKKTTSQLSMSFLLVSDTSEPIIKPVAQNIIIEDGHPMACPTNNNIIINDTYPNKEGIRTLMLYEFSSNKRIDIGTFKMIDDMPDITAFTKYTEGVDKTILSLMSPELFSFTRSGLHCDLHPRWDYNGKMVAFDSIHEGTRQMYVVEINKL